MASKKSFEIPILFIILILMLLLIVPGKLLSEEGNHKLPGTSVPEAPFVLTVHEGRLSLKAKDASIKQILETLGQRLHVNVIVRLPEQETISLTFEDLSVVEALQQFSPYVNYVAIEDAKTGQLTRLTVLSMREGVPGSRSMSGTAETVAMPASSTQEEPSRPAPFQFEFNPAAVPENKR
jgi:type II secretory pathway component GspD/PulD (secretin)